MSGIGMYTLDDEGRPVACPDSATWGRWMASVRDGRVVARTRCRDEASVSTVFLGLDHNFGDGGPPVLWESMAFDAGDEDMDRYTSREDAVMGHEAMVARHGGAA